MFGIGLPELMVIAFLGILFFGKDKIVGLAGEMGKSITAFRREVSEPIEQTETQE